MKDKWMQTFKTLSPVLLLSFEIIWPMLCFIWTQQSCLEDILCWGTDFLLLSLSWSETRCSGYQPANQNCCVPCSVAGWFLGSAASMLTLTERRRGVRCDQLLFCFLSDVNLICSLGTFCPLLLLPRIHHHLGCSPDVLNKLLCTLPDCATLQHHSLIMHFGAAGLLYSGVCLS